jgi:acyl-CoA thioester hydrolase
MMFSHDFLVQKIDIDEQGHVNNVAYVKWIQDVAVAHWFSATSEAQREKYIWIVIRHEIDYKKQAFETEEITATTWVGEPTRISWERFTKITRGSSLLVKARSVWCLIDRETSKPTRITQELKELFALKI